METKAPRHGAAEPLRGRCASSLVSSSADLPRTSRLALALLASALFAGCNGGLAGIGAAASDGGGSNSRPVVSNLVVQRSASSPARVSFVVFDDDGDATDVDVRYRDGASGSFQTITLGAGSPSMSAIRSDPGTPYAILWDFASDLGDESFHADLEIEVTVAGGTAPPVLAGVTMGDDPPVVSLARPLPETVSEFGANVDVGFVVSDSAGDTVDLVIEFNDDAVNGFPETSWVLARPASTAIAAPTPERAMLGLDTDATGVDATFRWDTEYDLAQFDDDVLVRLTAVDAYGAGPALVTSPFRVDNNGVPRIFPSEGAMVASNDERGDISVPFTLFDDEGDDVQVVVQWRVDSAPYPALPSDPAAVAAILADPDARRAHNICTERPITATGDVQPIDDTSVRLPELADLGSVVLNARASVVGDELAILRKSRQPEPLGLPSGVLDGPVAALPLGDGRTALVLDRDGSGWRVRELALATGTVVREIGGATGAIPTATALEYGGAAVLVAEDLGGAWQVRRLEIESGATEVLDGQLGGPVRGLASVGTDVSLMTVDDALVRFERGSPGVSRITVVRSGFEEPRGLAVDPAGKRRIFLAEHGTSGGSAGRVVQFDLDTFLVTPLADVPAPDALLFTATPPRLCVVTDEDQGDATRELRTVVFDGPEFGSICTLIEDLPPESAGAVGLTSGPESLLVLAIPGDDDLRVAGGLEQVRRVVAFDSERYIATVEVAFEPALTLDRAWRWSTSVPSLFRTSPTGRRGYVVWDSTEAEQGGDVQFLLTPFDADAGASRGTGISRRVRASLDVDPLVLDSSYIPQHVAIGDIDADGLPDVVATNFSDASIAVFLQDERGRFSTTANQILGDSVTTPFPRRTSVVDLDADGDLDLVVTCGVSIDSKLSIFRQAPTGLPSTPTEEIGIGFLSTPIATTTADLNGDGRPDIITGDVQSPSLRGGLSIFYQTSGGTFPNEPDEVLTPPVNQFTPTSVTSADVDGDGLLDLVAWDRGFTKVFHQDASGSFPIQPNRVLGSQGGQSGAAVVADLNGDGRLDLAATYLAGTDWGFSVYLQAANGSFPQESRTTLIDNSVIRVPSDLDTADVDGDGRTDLLLTSRGTGEVLVFFQGDEGFDIENRFALGNVLTASSVTAATVADIDVDGRPDIATCDSSISALVNVFLQSQGRGNFQDEPDQTIQWVNAYRSGIADVDSDGQPDVIVSDVAGARVFLQSGAGQLPSNPNHEFDLPGTSVNDVAVADLNSDELVDVVIPDTSSHRLAVFHQRPDGTFPETADLRLGDDISTAFPTYMATGDVNGDGRTDLACCSSGLGANFEGLALFYQRESGGLPTAPDVVLSEPGITTLPLGVRIADLDADGRADLITNFVIEDKLSVFYQKPDGSFPLRPTDLGDSVSTNDPRDVIAVDLDGDALLDLAVAVADGIAIFFQSEPRGFSATADLKLTGASSGYPRSIRAGDVNGDGLLDLAIAAGSVPSGVSIFEQVCPGRFPTTPSRFLPHPAFTAPNTADLVDLDGDGSLEIVTTGRGLIQVYESR